MVNRVALSTNTNAMNYAAVPPSPFGQQPIMGEPANIDSIIAPAQENADGSTTGKIAGIPVALHLVSAFRVMAEINKKRLVMSPGTYDELRRDVAMGYLDRLDEVIAVVQEAEETMQSVVKDVSRTRRRTGSAHQVPVGCGFTDLDHLHAQLKSLVGQVVAFRNQVAPIDMNESQLTVIATTYGLLKDRYDAIRQAMLETEGMLEAAHAVMGELMDTSWPASE